MRKLVARATHRPVAPTDVQLVESSPANRVIEIIRWRNLRALALAFSLAACAQISPAKGPARTRAPLTTPSSSIAVDYSTTIAIGSPWIFGSTGFPCVNCPRINEPSGYICCWGTSAQQRQLVNIGDKFLRWDASVERIVPNTSNSTYESALSSGCPSGSVCDPNSWNWQNSPTTEAMLQAKSLGIAIDQIGGFTTTWNSNTRTIYGIPTDWIVFEDIQQKLFQHVNPDVFEVRNEPEGGWPNTPSDYANVYYHTAHAIRAINANVPIGGPAISSDCGGPTGYACSDSYISAILTTKYQSIPPNWVNFISFHQYKLSPTVNMIVPQNAWSYRPGIPIYVTEWNVDSNGASGEDNDAADTVSFDGSFLTSMLANGFSGANHHSFQPAPPRGNASIFDDSTGAILERSEAYLLMSRQLKLGAGVSLVKQTSASGISIAAGAVNSAGNPVVVVVNHSGSPTTVSVNFNNLGLSGSVGLQTYLADHDLNNAQSAVENMNVNVSGGTLSHTITMTPYSVAGIVLNITSAPSRSRRRSPLHFLVSQLHSLVPAIAESVE
jgi:hypothetical protein